MSKGKFAKKLYYLIYTVKIRLSVGLFLIVLNFLTERFNKGNGEGEGANWRANFSKLERLVKKFNFKMN